MTLNEIRSTVRDAEALRERLRSLREWQKKVREWQFNVTTYQNSHFRIELTADEIQAIFDKRISDTEFALRSTLELLNADQEDGSNG